MKNNKGFTLVELISVIALLLVLSVLAVVAYSNITDAARQAAISSDANTLARALNSFNSVVNDGARITATTGITGTGGTFELVITAGQNGPVNLDLTVVTVPDRRVPILDSLVFNNGIWSVSLE